jgi:GNAT superfamily N-acetyltransferase
MKTNPIVRRAEAEEIQPMRDLYRIEMNCQIVHDSIHRRPGWTVTYLFEKNNASVGFGSVAVGGPWKDQPTLFEFFVLPDHRARAFELFEALLATGRAQRMEIQSNDALPAAMLHTYARDIASESIVFHDKLRTSLAAENTTLKPTTSDSETLAAIKERQGGPEWTLELDGQSVGKGGILFHYNVPYGDIYMEITGPFRRRGLGSYFVQELKHAAYRLKAIPCARCNTTNVASRRTLQKAGFVPFAHILTGVLE